MSLWRRLKLAGHVLALMFRADLRRAVLSLTPIVPGATALSYLSARHLLHALGRDDRAAVLVGAAMFTVAFVAAASLGRIARTARLQLGEALTFQFQLRRAGAVLAGDGIEHLERPANLDTLQTLSARSFDVNQAPRMFGWMIDSVGGLLVSTALLLSVEPLLALVVLGGIPAAALNGLEQARVRAAQTKEAERSRRSLHLYDLATRPEHAAEVRVAGVGGEILERYDADWQDADRSQYRAELRAGIVHAIGWLLQAAAFAAGVVVLIDAVADGRVPPADVFLALGAMGLVIGQVGQAVGGVNSLGQILWLFDQLEQVETVAQPAGDAASSPRLAPPDSLTRGVHLDGVTFRYEGAADDALRDVSLDLPAGSVVALVGDNGAGKSTLVKLLFGLYRPTSGQIRVDGTDLTEVDLPAWRRRCSACFQDHLALELVARESVGAGRLERIDDAEAVMTASSLAAATSVLDRLPDGIETQLGKRFGGADLSGGEWQKLAIARAMMRDDALLLALDEPSASLDPLTELEIFRQYKAAARDAGRRHGSVTVLVSHRFSTVSMADLVVVLDKGRVVEVGSHAELMAKRGLYAEMYELQARHYR